MLLGNFVIQKSGKIFESRIFIINMGKLKCKLIEYRIGLFT